MARQPYCQGPGTYTILFIGPNDVCHLSLAGSFVPCCVVHGEKLVLRWNRTEQRKLAATGDVVQGIIDQNPMKSSRIINRLPAGTSLVPTREKEKGICDGELRPAPQGKRGSNTVEYFLSYMLSPFFPWAILNLGRMWKKRQTATWMY
jgi:hypothetical protein